MRGNFDNTGKLIRFILKRELAISAIWLIFLILFSVSMAPAVDGMFDEAGRNALAETLKNPAIIAMEGPLYGDGNYTTGAIYSNMMLIWLSVTIGIMNIFLVIRHTRSDEEKGRSEVIRSLPVGRLANLNSVMIIAVGVNVINAIITGLGLALTQVESMTFAGCMLFGAALGAIGLVFAAVAALFSQLSSSSRGAIGYPVLILGIMYLLRAAGDIKSETLSLISPLGLVLRVKTFTENNYIPIFILLAEAVVITAFAYIFNSKRDIGQGLIPARNGKKAASFMLKSSFGLSFRLIRNTLIAWLIVMFALGASYGSILGDIEKFVSESEFYQMFIGINDNYSTMEMFTTTINSMMALICLIPILVIVLKPRGEEKDGRAENILARAVPKIHYLLGFIIFSFTAGVALMFSSSLGLHIASQFVLETPVELGFLLKASMVYLPALWFMIGISSLLTGLFPKLVNIIWVYFGFSFFISTFGGMLDFPEWLPKLSPFELIPQIPVDEVNYIALAVMTTIAVIMTTAGLIFYKRRDLH